MATTSLWHIKGRLKDLIDYVENPEKTASKMPELQDLYNVFSYVQRSEATQEGEYVTAINCLKETALRQMILAKRRYGKTDGYIAWHGYQSFKSEEVTPQLAHEIGVKLAKENLYAGSTHGCHLRFLPDRKHHPKRHGHDHYFER